MEPVVELMLWRWSTALQVASAVMIAGFFIVIARTARRVEAQPWGWAWSANLFALLVTVVFWYSSALSPVAALALRGGYILGKTTFVVLLTLGARAFAYPGARVIPRRWGVLVAALGAFTLLAVVFVRGIPRIGLLETSVITVGCVVGAAMLLREPTGRSRVSSIGIRSPAWPTGAVCPACSAAPTRPARRSCSSI